VLLIALWYRSFTTVDVPHLRVQSKTLLRATSFRGSIYFRIDKSTSLQDYWDHFGQHYMSRSGWWTPTIEEYAGLLKVPQISAPRFNYTSSSNFVSVQTPTWFWLVIALTAGAVPWQSWLRCRFSLRTLLIVTALVAALLGLITWIIQS
jgi:hypothetical protein